MEGEEEKNKGFKVDDRRRFSAQGEPMPEQTARAGQTNAAETPGSGTATSTASASQEYAAQAVHQQRGEPELNFVTFLVGLSTEALAALGEMPDPASGQRGRDLRAAQQLIDIIAMLRDKTRGNLDGDEQSLIEAILFDLRMKYVELARASAG